MAAACMLLLGSSLPGQKRANLNDLKKAQKAVQKGQKAETEGHLTEALAAYDEAAKEVPLDLGIVGRAAALRAKLVRSHVDAAESAALHGDLEKATVELHAALKIDPGNTIVEEREAQMRSMEAEEKLPEGPPEDYKLKGPPQLKPLKGLHSFNLKGDTRSAYEEVARAFGLTATFDPDLPSRNVKLRLDDADFLTAMAVLARETQSFWRTVNPTLIFVAPDTLEKRKEYALEVEQSFMVGAAVDPQDLTELLRTVREIAMTQHVELDTKSKSITIRDTAEKVKLAGALIRQAERARSELMLEIELLEVDRNKAQKLGIVPPQKARAFSISSADVKTLLQATDTANLLTLVQQVFAAQGISSIPPVIAVGGGKSTYLLSLPGAAANFSDALSLVRSGRELLMRVQDGKPATFFSGQRFPVTLSLLSTSLGGTTVTGAIPSTVFPRTDFNVGHLPVAVVAQDFDNDGKSDLAVVNQQDNSISVLMNQGSGNFTQPNNAITLGSKETGPAAIGAGIFRLTDATHLTQPADLVIANSTSNTVTVLLGNGDGTFAEAPGSPFAVGAQPRAVVLADFDGDGKLDFAVANSGDNSVSTFRGNGDGTFAPFPNSPFVLPAALQGPVAMVKGNFQNLSTTAADLAVVNQLSNNVAILEASGTNSFNGTFKIATGSPFNTGGGPVAIAAGDLNSDGVPDLAVVNQTDSTISVYLNNGDATFTVAAGSPLTTSASANPSGVVIADFTNDGIGDIAVTNQGLATLGIYVGLGFGTYLSQIELSTPPGPQGITTSDFDGNGLPDAALTAHSGTSNVVSVFLDPSTFSSTGSPLQVPYPGSEYIDLGIKVKATPSVHQGEDVTLQLEFEIRSLAGTSVNGIPVINNQTLAQTVRLKQDETALVGGLTDLEQTRAITALPGFGDLPGAGYAFGNRDHSNRDTELLILVTPRKLRILPRQAKTLYAGPGIGTATSGASVAPVSVPAPAPETPNPPPTAEPPPQ
jgi:Flp pilus assembly secretin CpaC